MATNQKVLTYHCTFCSHLLLATTLHLPSLPRRQPPGLDNAIIAPLPPPPRNPGDSSSDSESSSDDEELDSNTNPNGPSSVPVAPTPTPTSTSLPILAPPHALTSATPPPAAPPIEPTTPPISAPAPALSQTLMPPPPPPPPARRPRPRKPKEYTLLLSSTRDRVAKIITREDGFEKRYLWRCGRCKAIYGYQLDDMQYPSLSKPLPHNSAKGKEPAETAARIRGAWRWKTRDYVYFLPGALTSTEELGSELKEEDAYFQSIGGD